MMAFMYEIRMLLQIAWGGTSLGIDWRPPRSGLTAYKPIRHTHFAVTNSSQAQFRHHLTDCYVQWYLGAHKFLFCFCRGTIGPYYVKMMEQIRKACAGGREMCVLFVASADVSSARAQF